MLLYPEVRRFVCHGSFCFWTVKVHRVARRPLFCSTLVHLFQQGSSLAQSKSHRSRVFRESRFFCFHEHRSSAKQTTKLTNHESKCLSQPNHHNSNLHCHSGDWFFERSSYLFLTCVNEERSICREYPFRHQGNQEVMRRGMHEGKKLLRRDFHVAGINPSDHVRGRSATATCIHRG